MKLFSWIRIIVRVFVSLVIAGSLALVIIQEDPWFKQHLEQIVNTAFCSLYECNFTSRLSSIKILQGSLELHDLQATGVHDCQWSWQARKSTITWSWLDLLWYRSCGVHMIVERLICNSGVSCSGRHGKDAIAIAPHIELLTMPTELAIPFYAASCAVRDGAVYLYDSDTSHKKGYTVSCSFSVDAHLVPDALRSTIRISQGYLAKDSVMLLDAFEGTSFCYVPHQNEGAEHMTLVANLSFPRLPRAIQDVGLRFDWYGGQGKCHITNEDCSLAGECSIRDYSSLSGRLRVPLIYLYSLISTDDQPDVQGDAQIDMSVDGKKFDETLSVELTTKNVRYYGTQIPDFFITGSKDDEHVYAGTLALGDSAQREASGVWSLNMQTLYLKAHMNTDAHFLLPGFWDIHGGTLSVYGDVGAINNVSGDFTTLLAERASGQMYPMHGSLSCTPECFFVDGTVADRSFELICGLQPGLYCELLRYQEDEASLIEFGGAPDGSFHGSIAYPVIRKLIKLSGNDVPGVGTIQVKGTYAHKAFQADCSMPDASVRLPLTYSVIKSFAGKVSGDFVARKFCCTDFTTDLYKGSVTCSQATMWCDEQYNVAFLHCPLVAHKCFLSWKKDLFVEISGTVLAQYTQEELMRLEGQLVLDQSHVRGNILSAEFQNDLFGPGSHSIASHVRGQVREGQRSDCTLALSVLTRAPLEIKTPFLDASAKCDVKIGGVLSDPEITGTIDFLSGALAFPYKPLFISRGNITFMPRYPDDPAIELVARNTIKKYSVELAITGSAQNPRIAFSSSPHLDREQIITLLLGGSEDGSLCLVMPRMITDTLEHLLFGSAEASSRVQKYFKSLFRPFKQIRIVPSFSDQAGRGGVRGSVAIEVNDTLRAVFEKNFSLTEDATFEVEYLISDDTSVRVVKDERGDLGLEGEMRWKF